MKLRGRTVIVVDALWGDGGKGKISAFIAKENNFNLAVRAGTGTNAGHSIYVDGKLIKTNQLPLAGILPNNNGSYPLLAVGSGVCYDPVKAQREINEYNLHGRIMIDNMCPVITEEHKQREASGEQYSETHTGSTKSGTGESRVDRVKRIGICAKDLSLDFKNNITLCNIMNYINSTYDNGGKIIVEGTQGYYLSLYLSNEYPVVTSDNCTSTAFADDVGLPWNKIDEVCMVIKSAPTRVSQNCGALPGEISKEEIEKLGIIERGVTTGRLRRKSLTIPLELLDESVMANQPTYFALTFCDHVDANILDLPKYATKNDLSKNGFVKTLSNINDLEKRYQIPVKYVEYGKDFKQISMLI